MLEVFACVRCGGSQLKPLPATPFELTQWQTATVNIDYHVEFEKHWYSVPYKLVGKRVDIRATATCVTS